MMYIYVQVSFEDLQILVEALKQVDVVISAVAGLHHFRNQILQQLKLVEAIKEVGNICYYIAYFSNLISSREG